MHLNLNSGLVGRADDVDRIIACAHSKSSAVMTPGPDDALPSLRARNVSRID
jgi:hypothetical protein